MITVQRGKGMNCFDCINFDGEYCRLCFQIREDYVETTRKIANPEAEEYCEWFEKESEDDL